jgi:Big-like domain-containing protein
LLILVSSLFTAACAGPSATAPSTTPPSLGTALSKVSLFWRGEVYVYRERQIEARATYADGTITDITTAVTSWTSSNPKIATISNTGVVKGLAIGASEISATYAGMKATLELHVGENFGPAFPDEVVGYVKELTVFGPVDIAHAEVEIVGGSGDGRKVLTDTSGLFRLVGLQSPGFDLIVREAAYSTKRFRVSQLGVDVSSETVMTPAPTMVSDVLEGDVCGPTRTISATFTPTVAGFLRITSNWGVRTATAVYGDGILVNPSVGDNGDVSMRAGVRYELRANGDSYCGEDLGKTARLTFLRPR